MPLISVIVPVYKVEAYLPACVDSILAQTCTDFELILVDDGSPDSCGAICDKYAQKDPRVRVIHQENGGLSAARNAGMDVARGEYITFVDSDDLIAPDSLSCLANVAADTNADIVAGRFVNFADADDPATLWDRSSPAAEYSVAEPRAACLQLYRGSPRLPINACGKLFRRSRIGTLRFPVGRIHEDQAFVPLAVYHASRIALLDRVIYGYRHNEAGITHSRFSNRRYDDIWAIDQCISFFESCHEVQIVAAAKRKREILLARYSLLARNAGVKPPKDCRVPLLKAIHCLKKNTSEDSFSWYMGFVHPKLPIACEYVRKIKRMIAGK